MFQVSEWAFPPCRQEQFAFISPQRYGYGWTFGELDEKIDATYTFGQQTVSSA